MNLAWRRSWSLLLLVAVAGLAAAGCAGSRPEAEPVEDPGSLPRWVRIVPVPGEGTTWYVGAVSMASDEEDAVRLGRLDALSQISRDARERFAELITRANAGSGVDLKPIERFQLSDVGREMYATRVEDAAQTDDVHLKPCADVGTTICEAYVLVSVPATVWDRELNETLTTLRKEEVAAGREKTAAYLDWMIRHQEQSSH